MQQDFHFYCIGVLAKAAGFSKEEAITIAYSSQYTDDSTESEPIRVGEMLFDPVRTAHKGIKAFEWSVQKRVFLAFHFIPAKPIETPQDTFCARSNSEFAQMILHRACMERSKRLRPYRIGIALHTFADSWAHQYFSGREHKENNVEGIHIKKGDKWKHLFFENIYLDLLPHIGHGQAGYFPDQSYTHWEYQRKLADEVIERDNTIEFLDAAKQIYDSLKSCEKENSSDPIPWNSIKGDIEDLLSNTEKKEEKRFEKWRAKFGHLFAPNGFDYDKNTWRNEALQPDKAEDVEWDDYKPHEFKKLEFKMTPGFYNTPWVRFHRAALRQRHYVLENLL
jgi:hypothetical protein